MTDQVRFEVPESIEESMFQKYFADNIAEYKDALDQSAYDYDDRSVVDDIRLESIDLYPDSVTIYYNVDISAYHGCRDANYAETDVRDVTGSRQGRLFTFDKFVYPERRSTHDEL